VNDSGEGICLYFRMLPTKYVAAQAFSAPTVCKAVDESRIDRLRRKQRAGGSGSRSRSIWNRLPLWSQGPKSSKRRRHGRSSNQFIFMFPITPVEVGSRPLRFVELPVLAETVAFLAAFVFADLAGGTTRMMFIIPRSSWLRM